MFEVFLVIQAIITLAMVGFILIQRTDSDGLGSMGGGGGANALMTGRGAANFMTRATAILATLFMLNSLWLGIMATRMHGGSSLTEELEMESTAPQVPVLNEQVAPTVVPPVDATSSNPSAAPTVPTP